MMRIDLVSNTYDLITSHEFKPRDSGDSDSN